MPREPGHPAGRPTAFFGPRFCFHGSGHLAGRTPLSLSTVAMFA
ncbi:hypothetical protein B4100_2703 [Heyndrickxia coagulans]|nr:hypothetical protein B4100_2703 [Heyndrickxia coagulans]